MLSRIYGVRRETRDGSTGLEVEELWLSLPDEEKPLLAVLITELTNARSLTKVRRISQAIRITAAIRSKRFFIALGFASEVTPKTTKYNPENWPI